MDRRHSSPDERSCEWRIAIDQVCDSFEKAWREGQTPRIEDRLGEVADAHRATLLKELLLLECAYRLKNDKTIPASDYLARFPEHAALVREAIGDSRNFDTVSGKAAGASSIKDPLLTVTSPHEPEMPAPATGAAMQLPESIDRYRIERLLGQGGFGLVYLAHDSKLDRSVAIKVAHPKLVADAANAQAYMSEARVVAGLDHPSIVPVYAVGSTEQFPCYVVSKYIAGTTLEAKLKQWRPTHAEAAELVATVADALHYAHKRGVVHRDMKPGNILLDVSGRPFVADFGLALREQDLGKVSGYFGTPAYMSPEQARGEADRVDGRSDIFSLGIVFYELLTGRRPFKGDSTGEVLEQVILFECRPPRQVDDGIPTELERICLKSLEKRPADRYTTAKDMASDLRNLLPTQNTAASLPANADQRTWKFTWRHAAALGGLLVVALLLVVGVTSGVFDRGTPNSSAPTETVAANSTAGAVLPLRDASDIPLTKPEDSAAPRAAKRLTVADSPGEALPGLVLQPRAIPGVGRWQVTTVAPGASGTWAIAWSPDSTQLAHSSSDRYIRIYDVRQRRLDRIMPTGPSNGACSLSWSRDGRLAACTFHEGDIYIWDAEQRTRQSEPGRGYVLAWSPEGERLAVADPDGNLSLLTPGQKAVRIAQSSTPRKIESLSWSPDGSRIVTGDVAGEVRIWHLQRGLERTHKAHAGMVRAVSWSPTGQWIVSGGQDGKLRLWDAASGEEGPKLAGHNTIAWSLSWKPDGKEFVSGNGDYDYRAKVWSVDGGQPKQSLPWAASHQRAVSWSPDGGWIVAGADRLLQVWDAVAGRASPPVVDPGPQLSGLAWSPDGGTLATGDHDGLVRLWQANGGLPEQQLQLPSPREVSLAWSPSGDLAMGQRLNTTGHNSGGIYLWPSAPSGEVRKIAGDPLGISWGPGDRLAALDGKQLQIWPRPYLEPDASAPATAWEMAWRPGGEGLATMDRDGTLRIRRDNGAVERSFPATGTPLYGPRIAWSAEARYLAATTLDGICLYDMVEDKMDRLQFQSTYAVAFEPSAGGVLACGRGDGALSFISMRTKNEIFHRRIHVDRVHALAWDPAGQRLASGSPNGTIQLWDHRSQRTLWKAVLLPHGKSATFSVTGELLHADPGAEEHLVYLVEDARGMLQHYTSEQFRELTAAADGASR